jgi:hypothetical protein
MGEKRAKVKNIPNSLISKGGRPSKAYCR